MVGEFFSPTVAERFDEFMTNTEPLPPRWIIELPDQHTQAVRALQEQYRDLGALCMFLSPYSRKTGVERPQIPLRPLLSGSERVANLPNDVLDAVGWKELLKALTAHIDVAMASYDQLRLESNTQ